MVIIGFSAHPVRDKLLFSKDGGTRVTDINPYLCEGPVYFIDSRNKPICDKPIMIRGCQPTDDGNLLLSKEEANAIVSAHPIMKTYIRPFMMGADFIRRKPRYCLWLVDAPLSILNISPVRKRVQAVKDFRLKSSKEATQKKAQTPYLFDEIKPLAENCKYVAIPVVSSERREYIPIDYIDSIIIPGNKLFYIKESSIFDFGVLNSSVHMAWMRAVSGRLEMRYSYSNTIVYNNFPWPEPSGKQKAKIEATAQSILDARANHPAASLADLYDPLLMPLDLRKAHDANDKAVKEAYGMPKDITEPEIVSWLLKMHQKLTAADK